MWVLKRNKRLLSVNVKTFLNFNFMHLHNFGFFKISGQKMIPLVKKNLLLQQISIINSDFLPNKNWSTFENERN
jgi:hypothetical protein